MSDIKKIERFFEEKFKDFEVNPSPEIWNKIALKLENKKNKKRIFPIWFKVIGIAASLVIGYFIISNYSRDDNFDVINSNTIIVKSEKKSLRKPRRRDGACPEQRSTRTCPKLRTGLRTTL